MVGGRPGRPGAAPRGEVEVDVEGGHHAIGLSHPAGRMIGIGLRAREP